MAMHPQTLNVDGIAARIPHQGRMCLLQTLRHWSAEDIVCTATSHRDTTNPLRTGGVLWAACAIEYASQAMALHGVLNAGAGSTPRAGFLVSVRNVQQRVARLDTVPGALQVAAFLLAGDSQQASYRFEVSSAAGELLVSGRASVVLDATP